MTLLKAQIRAGLIGEVGQKAGDAAEAAKREVASYDGAKQALATAAKNLEQLNALVDRDVDEGKLSLEQAKAAKQWVERCGGVVRNLLVNAEVQSHVARGKLQQAQAFSGQLEKLAAVELNHAEALAAAEREQRELVPGPPDRPRAVGERPGPSIAAQRKAEAKPAAKKRTKRKG